MILATCSAKHSPGATTTALALVCAMSDGDDDRRALLVEVDPAGGDLAARLGLPADPGLASLAAASRHGGVGVGFWRHATALPGGGAAVLAPADPAKCAAAGRHAVPSLRTAAEHESVDLVLDMGRLGHGEALGDATVDAVAVVCRPDLSGIEHARRLIEQLRSTRSGTQVVAVTVGDRPYDAAEVQDVTGVPALALPHDPAGAAALLTGPARRARRSALVRSARTILDQIPVGATL
jgi:Flp pilus assembly CpaE family ATPase